MYETSFVSYSDLSIGGAAWKNNTVKTTIFVFFYLQKLKNSMLKQQNIAMETKLKTGALVQTAALSIEIKMLI